MASSMCDIFLSYAREDEGRAGELAEALERQGYSVFWDRQIPVGGTWRSSIGAALGGARCVVVLWSEHSLKSEWVMEEADKGKQRGILAPAMLDDAGPPLGFGAIQAADLSQWSAGRPSRTFDDLLNGIAAILQAPPATPSELSVDDPPEQREPPRTRSEPPLPVDPPRPGRPFGRPWVLGPLLGCVVVAAGLGYWWPRDASDPWNPWVDDPTVAAAPAPFLKLFTNLLSDDRPTRVQARSDLAALGPEAVPAMMAKLRTDGSVYRTSLGILVALTEMLGNDKRLAGEVSAQLTDDDLALLVGYRNGEATIQKQADEFFVALGDPRAVMPAPAAGPKGG